MMTTPCAVCNRSVDISQPHYSEQSIWLPMPMEDEVAVSQKFVVTGRVAHKACIDNPTTTENLWE